MSHKLTRRSFLAFSATSAGFILTHKLLPLQQTAQASAGNISIQSGDVTSSSAIIWGRGDRNSRLVVDYSTSPNFRGRVTSAVGAKVTAETDYTGTVELVSLRPNTTYYYQARFVESAETQFNNLLQGLIGRFRTAPASFQARPIRFVWAADMAGQGWGRNPNLKITASDGEEISGGYVIFDVMRKLRPDFALFSGDMIYTFLGICDWAYSCRGF